MFSHCFTITCVFAIFSLSFGIAHTVYKFELEFNIEVEYDTKLVSK